MDRIRSAKYVLTSVARATAQVLSAVHVRERIEILLLFHIVNVRMDTTMMGLALTAKVNRYIFRTSDARR